MYIYTYIIYIHNIYIYIYIYIYICICSGADLPGGGVAGWSIRTLLKNDVSHLAARGAPVLATVTTQDFENRGTTACPSDLLTVEFLNISLD